MRFLKRLFCIHYYAEGISIESWGWHRPSWAQRGWTCRKCGKIIVRGLDWIPVNFVEGE